MSLNGKFFQFYNLEVDTFRSGDYIIKDETEEEIMKNAVQHAWEIHAIKPKE
jgi:hypothetical protein